TTASIIPVATATAPSVSSIKPSSGSSTTWTNNCPGRISSSPSPSLRRSDPSSARISASRTTLCSTPLLSLSNGWPKTSASSGQTSLVSLASYIPGAGNSSITRTSTTSFLAVDSRRTARPGSPPAPTSLSLCKPSHPSTAPSSKKICATPDYWN